MISSIVGSSNAEKPPCHSWLKTIQNPEGKAGLSCKWLIDLSVDQCFLQLAVSQVNESSLRACDVVFTEGDLQYSTQNHDQHWTHSWSAEDIDNQTKLMSAFDQFKTQICATWPFNFQLGHWSYQLIWWLPDYWCAKHPARMASRLWKKSCLHRCASCYRPADRDGGSFIFLYWSAKIV